MIDLGISLEHKYSFQISSQRLVLSSKICKATSTTISVKCVDTWTCNTCYVYKASITHSYVQIRYSKSLTKTFLHNQNVGKFQCNLCQPKKKPFDIEKNSIFFRKNKFRQNWDKLSFKWSVNLLGWFLWHYQISLVFSKTFLCLLNWCFLRFPNWLQA